MKRKLFFILSVFVFLAFAPPQDYEWKMDDTVYYSTGPTAYSYHARQNCGHIKECLEEGHVRSCTRKEAIEKHKRQPCGTCLKKEHTYWRNKGWLKH